MEIAVRFVVLVSCPNALFALHHAGVLYLQRTCLNILPVWQRATPNNNNVKVSASIIDTHKRKQYQNVSLKLVPERISHPPHGRANGNMWGLRNKKEMHNIHSEAVCSVCHQSSGIGQVEWRLYQAWVYDK